MLFRAQKVLHLTVITLTIVQTASSQELTEAELIERFLAQSPQIRALRAGLATTRAEVRSRTLYPNPTANYTREGAGFTEFLEFEQPLIITNRPGRRMGCDVRCPGTFAPGYFRGGCCGQ